MKIRKIWLISFSPTRTSKSVIDAIASGIVGIPHQSIDLTYPDQVLSMQFAADELAIIGVPVYAGRVAPLAVERLAAMHGSNTPAVVVATYGNRDFEDALVELRDIAEQAAFKPLIACTFIGEHSFSGPDIPIAAERPDTVDLATARKFGVKILEKLETIEDIGIAPSVNVPGNKPYKEGMGALPFTPKVLPSKCTLCAVCLGTCPTGAISLNPQIEVDVSLCIFCCACIKNCPEEAMIIDAAPIKEKRQWLYENCVERKEPELFL
jgi:ferredoxin